MGMFQKIKSRFDLPSTKEQWGWVMYDFANASFVASYSGVFMGPYVTTLSKEEACHRHPNDCSWCSIDSSCIPRINATMCAADICTKASKWCCNDDLGTLTIGSTTIGYGSFFPYCITAAVIAQVILLPILGALADYSRSAKKYFMATTYASVLFVLLTFFVDGPDLWWLGGLLYVGATVLFGIASVFYDTFLNYIADSDYRTSLSSIGYGIGYVGATIYLAFSIACFPSHYMLFYNLYGSFLTVRVILGGAGIWWGFFSIFTFVYLRERKKQYVQEEPGEEEGESLLRTGRKKKRGASCIKGMLQLRESFRAMRYLPHALIFLIASAFYNDGIMTAMSLTSIFGQEALGLTSTHLGMAVLMVQFVAFFGAFMFNLLAKRIGDKNSTLITLFVWTVSITVINFIEFMCVAFVVGFVLGGSQALSRGMFAKMIPKGYESQMFSFYQLSQRGTSWMGPLVYGLLTTYLSRVPNMFIYSEDTLTLYTRFDNNPRPGVLAIAGFVIVGGIILFFVNEEKARLQAKYYSKNPQESIDETNKYTYS